MDAVCSIIVELRWPVLVAFAVYTLRAPISEFLRQIGRRVTKLEIRRDVFRLTATRIPGESDEVVLEGDEPVESASRSIGTGDSRE